MAASRHDQEPRAETQEHENEYIVKCPGESTDTKISQECRDLSGWHRSEDSDQHAEWKRNPHFPLCHPSQMSLERVTIEICDFWNQPFDQHEVVLRSTAFQIGVTLQELLPNPWLAIRQGPDNVAEGASLFRLVNSNTSDLHDVFPLSAAFQLRCHGLHSEFEVESQISSECKPHSQYQNRRLIRCATILYRI